MSSSVRQPLWLAALLAVLSAGACSLDPPRHTSQFLAFGTLMELTLADIDARRAETVRAQIEAEFAALHAAWHAWDPGPLAQINRAFAAGERVPLPSVVQPLVAISRELSERSEGLFDPAIGRLVDLWGFHRDDPRGSRPPRAEAIHQLLLQRPGMRDVRVEAGEIFSVNPAVKLDFGAIGKGYGIDLAIARLREMGVRNAIVNGGGDLRAIGDRGDGKPWRIAIRHPDGERLLGTLEVAGDESVFTSGSYERNYHWQGAFYHHIIDPRNGYPAQGTASVTVIHSDAATADAAATALFVAGPRAWHRIARQMGVKMVLLMTESGDLHMNPEMHTRVRLNAESTARVRLSPPLTSDGARGGTS